MSETNLDVVIPNVSVQIAGKQYECIISLEAFCEIERHTGVSALSGDILKNTVTNITLLAWAGSKAFAPELTLDYVRKNMTLKELGDNWPILIGAINKALGIDEKAEKKSVEAKAEVLPE